MVMSFYKLKCGYTLDERTPLNQYGYFMAYAIVFYLDLVFGLFAEFFR